MPQVTKLLLRLIKCLELCYAFFLTMLKAFLRGLYPLRMEAGAAVGDVMWIKMGNNKYKHGGVVGLSVLNDYCMFIFIVKMLCS